MGVIYKGSAEKITVGQAVMLYGNGLSSSIGDGKDVTINVEKPLSLALIRGNGNVSKLL